jgi:methylated-DNA-[protein]-cysteine S-methyltransferase
MPGNMTLLDRKSCSDPDPAAVIAFPAMRVGISTRDEMVAAITYLPPETPLLAPLDRIAERAARQLERYRDDPDAAFDLPLAMRGTPFQRRVWRALERIPRGEIRTYGALAVSLGTAARAVGQACGENRFPLVIPCHRVVAAGGIGGFAHARTGYLLEAKRWLLEHERAI